MGDDHDEALLASSFDPERFRNTGRELIEVLGDYLKSAMARELPVLEWSVPNDRVAEFMRDFERPEALNLPEFVSAVLARANHLHHPRYVGHQVTSPLPEAALLELVSALSNNGAAVYEMGPVEVAMERALVSFMSQRFGWTDSADGFFTSGGSAGNLTALLAARQERAGFDVWTEGVAAGPPLAFLAADQAHYSVKRALQIGGLGEGGVEAVPVDARFKLRPECLPDALGRARARGRKVIGVVASAGSTATGAYDPLEPIADFCEEHDLWLHVDGAHGAFATLSPKLRARVAGIDRADSVVWDAHKMLLMPALATAVLFRQGSRSYESFAQKASYLFNDVRAEDEWFNLASRTLECTKRFMALPLYTLLAKYGAGFFAHYAEKMTSLAERFAELIEQAPDFELAVQPESNIVCFRHVPRDLPSERLDRLQAEIRARLVTSGAFYLVQTRLSGALYLRTTLINPLTTESDLAALLEQARAAARLSLR
jgi:L-2,4-diaminobutyrate decarboxylase